MINRLRSLVLAGAIGLTGCAALLPVVGPATELVACVTSDALGGKSLAQTQSDCKADELAVVTTLLGSTDSKVKASAAYGEAVGKASAAYKAGAARDAGH